MKKHLRKLIVLLIGSVFFVSCVTSKKLTYLQYEGIPSDTVIAVTPADYKVLPFDNLFIRVVTPDPKWSEMFNTLPVTSAGISVTEMSADLISYQVDGSGAIFLPYAGKIVVAGKTLADVTAEVEKALKGYIADAAVTVKMINNYISLLGEVKNPGRYPIYKDRLNIFQALAMGGDLSEYSNRQKLQVIRQTTAGSIIKEFSLTDRSIMSSEFFYVMPNDVIYAEPMKGKFFQLNSFPYTLILSTITTFILLWNVLKL
jgi:polysaccharide export outer membrane protein